MNHVIDAYRPTQTLGGQAWLNAGLSSPDVVASLSAGLADAWEVERAVDPSGDVTIIILPVLDAPGMPTFMLYEEDGLARVATIRRDVWESDQAFLSCPKAVAAIIAARAALPAAA
jgi:hypothetical protein